MKSDKTKIKKKVDEYIIEKKEDLKKKYKILKNSLHILYYFADNLGLKSQKRRYLIKNSRTSLDAEQFCLEKQNYHKQLPELQKKTVLLYRKDYVSLFNPYNEL